MAEIIYVPKHMLEELVRRSEALQRFIVPNVESRTSFDYFRSKLDEILTFTAAGSSSAVNSRPVREQVQLPPPPPPPPADEEEEEEEEIDEEEGEDEEQREEEQREVTSESRKRKVARRTRRVAKKLRIRDERQVSYISKIF